MPVSLPRNSFPIGGGGGLAAISAPLVETMEIVEPLKEEKVPDHLLESKIFSKITHTTVVEAQPASLHFGGFELNKKCELSLSLVNTSGDVQRVHIIPPQTKHFKIKYQKRERMVPGLAVDCTVEFVADEWRYYYDCIRVHCPGEENLLIPIHAYPIMTTDDFPQFVSFPPVPIGQTAIKTIPLVSTAPIDFEFQLSCVQRHPSFTVEPMSGVVPASGEVVITVTYSPTEFVTAVMKLQLAVSQFNSKPLVCTFIGRSPPGLEKDHTIAALKAADDTLDPRDLSPVQRARDNKKKTKKQNKRPDPPPQEIEVEGLKIPVNTMSPWAVGQVITQTPGKMRAKDLREVLRASNTPDKSSNTRQAKEAKFEAAVRRDVYEERQNHLRWQVKVGELPMTSDQRHHVGARRDKAWHGYRLGRGDPVVEDEYERRKSKQLGRRTFRDKDNLGSTEVQFDTYSNDPWRRRHVTLERFIRAARTIIVRQRADRYLYSLKQVVQLARGGMTTSHAANFVAKQHHRPADVGVSEESVIDDEEEDEEEEAQLGPPRPLHLLRRSGVATATFPTYVAPNVRDDMAPDALGDVPYLPTEVVFKGRVPFFELLVPQTYDLMGYRKYSVHQLSQGYVPTRLSRPLRTGAEDEVISIPALAFDPLSPRPLVEDDVELQDLENTPRDTRPAPKPLVPPDALTRPVEYPPLHVFNPSPGLQVFLPPVPYSETDGDFHLCPLPRYLVKDSTSAHTATQKKYLDREDTIRGVMAWKKLPSQGLTCLSNTPTLTAVWVPRWSDPFQTSLLPTAGPVLQSGLGQQDRECVAEQQEVAAEEGEGGVPKEVTLHPDMVAAQFATSDVQGSNVSLDQAGKDNTEYFPYGNRMPATNLPVGPNGHVPREKREEELDWFIRRKSNKLGGRVKVRVQQLNDLKSSSRLILK